MSCFFKMIVGFLFLAFRFQVEIVGMTVDVLSDIIGYGLIIWSCKEMIEWSPCFKKTRKNAILALILYVGNVVMQNFNASSVMQGVFLGFGTITFIYMTYYILEGLYVKNKTEKVYEVNSQLKGAWIAMAVARFLYCFFSLADLETLTEELGIVGSESFILQIIEMIGLLTQVFFILTLNQNRVLLEENQKKQNIIS